MEAGFHHLYEYGNIPIFLTVGQSQEEVVVGKDGNPEVCPMMKLKFSFDERIEDGLYCMSALEFFKQMVEDPEAGVSSIRWFRSILPWSTCRYSSTNSGTFKVLAVKNTVSAL
jgi:hypothetical protein